MSDSDYGEYIPPPGYEIPAWPGLYNPSKDGVYLYSPAAIWRFTLYWTLLFNGIVFFLCGLMAFAVFARRHLLPALGVMIFFVIFGLVVAFVSGTIVGFAIAALYNSAFLRMSTWVPFLWGAAQTLVLIISSYSTLTTIL